jgi:hypothetical protein
MAHTAMAPNKLEKEKNAGSTRPRLRLRTVHFRVTTIRATVKTNSAHDTPAKQIDLKAARYDDTANCRRTCGLSAS